MTEPIIISKEIYAILEESCYHNLDDEAKLLIDNNPYIKIHSISQYVKIMYNMLFY